MGIEIKRWVWIGVDLGQRRDYSAIAVVERVFEQSTVEEFIRTGLDGQWWFRVRMLERHRLLTPYTDVVRRVKRITEMPEVAMGRTVVVDGTGVGPPVVDMLRQAGLGCQLTPSIITGAGRSSGRLRDGYESVPRAELLTGMQVLVQQGRLRVASGCREAEALRREMLALKMKGRPSEGEHDDLALAVALALWKARVGVRYPVLPR